MSILNQFVVPTINLDFKLMTQNRNILSGLRAIVSETGATVDFAALRASVKRTENRFGVIEQADANVPALSFNNGVAQGFLSEEAATNLFLRSEEFDNAYWGKLGTVAPTVTPNAIVSPDGTVTADLLTGTGGGGMRLQRSVTVTTGAHTFSIYVKQNTSTTARFNIFDGTTDRGVTFTFATESFVTSGAVSASFEKLPNGWYRIIGSYASFASTSINVQINIDGVGAYFIWGAQLETGSRASTYIKTVAATATRAKDNVTISDVAIALSTTSGSIQTTSNFPTDYPLIVNGLQATVTGIKTIRFEYTTTTIELYVDNVLADSATGTYDWSDLNEIQLGHYNGADQPNFELRDLIVRKA